jgi:hypothetical protein
MNLAIKNESLEYSNEYALEVNKVLKCFIEENFMIHEAWVNEIECRRRDGFIPYSNNMGGYTSCNYGCQLHDYFCPTGFENYDKVCVDTYDYVTKCYLEDRKISIEEYNKALDNNCTDMISIRDEIEMGFGEYEGSCYKAMLKLEHEDTLYVAFTLSASDAPYFRNYDDIIEFEITFNNANELKQKLNNLLSHSDVNAFIGVFHN